jgi:flagellar export protein FliJ
MSKYNFRLRTLLRLREIQRDEKRNRLAEAYQAESILSDQQQEVLEELYQLQQLQRNSMGQPQTNINQLIEVGRYQLTLQTQQTTMEKQAEILAAEVTKRREALVESDRQVRVLEKFQQRQQQQHQKQQERKEAKVYDEIGQHSHHSLSYHTLQSGDRSET